MYQLVIPLSGLNCMGCARKVEKALHANHDVEILNLSPTQVEVKTESSLKELVSSIESLGYQAGNHYEINLSGLSCGGCVKKLSSLLESNQDVISFEASTTHLEIRTLLSEQQVIDLIATLGYTANLDSVEVENESSPETEPVEKQSNIKDTQVPPASIQLQMLIQGMTCASCVSSVEKALTNVEGVEKAQVNLAEQSALVFASKDSDDLLNAIVESVKQAGYQAEILQDAATQQE
ncbi:cation transporter, partial [Vibrio parahaemolyticus]|nr:cation transporter [Vibrio parahaemolyticus]